MDLWQYLLCLHAYITGHTKHAVVVWQQCHKIAPCKTGEPLPESMIGQIEGKENFVLSNYSNSFWTKLSIVIQLFTVEILVQVVVLFSKEDVIWLSLVPNRLSHCTSEGSKGAAFTWNSPVLLVYGAENICYLNCGPSKKKIFSTPARLGLLHFCDPSAWH